MRLAHIAAVALLCGLPGFAQAHHGWSSYDAEKTLTINTTLTALKWTNPHGAAKISYNDQSWDVVLAPVTRMESRGLTEAMLKPGRKLTLVGYPRSDGTHEMRIERVILDGKTYELR